MVSLVRGSARTIIWGSVLRENFPAEFLPRLERRQELDQVGRVEELGRSDGADRRPRDGRDHEPAALHHRFSALATFEERTEVVEVAVRRDEKVSTRTRTQHVLEGSSHVFAECLSDNGLEGTTEVPVLDVVERACLNVFRAIRPAEERTDTFHPRPVSVLQCVTALLELRLHCGNL